MRTTLFLFTFVAFSAWTQEYSPFLESIRTQIEESKEEIEDLSSFTKAQQKIIRNAHEEKIKYQLKLLTPENVITEGKLYDYVNDILEKIKVANPDIPSNTKLVITKDIYYNAFTFGNHVIYMHIGLLMELKNEAEIAMVVGHEIAHVTLYHSREGIVNSAIVQTNKELKAEIKEARKRDYGRVSALNEILAPRLFESKETSRKHEYSADSLGFLYLKNGGFNVEHSLYQFFIMQEHDEGISVPLDYTLFPQKTSKKLTELQESYRRHGSLGAVQKNNKFEPYLRSHPYSEDRLRKLLIEYDLSPDDRIESERISPAFDTIKADLLESTIQAACHKKSYTTAIYLTHKYKDYFVDSLRYDELMMTLFQSLSYFKERRVSGRYLSLQDPQQKEDFDRLTYSLMQLSPEDCDKIAAEYSDKLKPSSTEKEEWIIAQMIKYTREENFENIEILYKDWYDIIRIGTHKEVYFELDNYWRNVKLLKFVKPHK